MRAPKLWTTTDAILGALIMQVRQQAGLTQPELAQRSGLTQSNLSRVENGQPITVGQLLRLCSSLPWSAATVLNVLQSFRRGLRRRIAIVDHGAFPPEGGVKLTGKALIPFVRVKI